MRSGLFTLLLILVNLISCAQEFEVTEFAIVPNDLTARINGRVDGNGRKCAVIKVYADDHVVAVRGATVGEVTGAGMEKLVYMAHDSKAIELVFEHHLPLKIEFDNYNIPSLTGMMTYVLKLKETAGAPQGQPIQNDSHLPNEASYVQSSAPAQSRVENTRKGTDIFIEEFVRNLCSSYNVQLGTTPISEVETRFSSTKKKGQHHYEVKIKDKTEFVDSKDNGLVSLLTIHPKSAKDLRLPDGITTTSSFKEWNEWFVEHGFQSQTYAPYFMKQAMMTFISDRYELILMFDGKENKQQTLFAIIMCKK